MKVLVTGATGEIGSALLAGLFAKYGEGLELLVTDYDQQRLDELLTELISRYDCANRLHSYAVDFNQLDKVEEFTGQIREKFSNLDILLNVAGVGVYKPLGEITDADWHLSLNVNLNAPFLLMRELTPILQGGKIINVGSGVGVIPMPGRVAYVASKFALRGLSLSLSKELAGQVSVVLLTLGSIMTQFGPLSKEDKEKLAAQGKKYLSVESVVEKVLEIVATANPQSEYTYYPEGYDDPSAAPANAV